MRVHFLAAALLVSARPATLHACSCFNAGSRAAVRAAAAVFLGRVISTAPRRHEAGDDIRMAQVRVTRAIKGADIGQTKDVEYLVDTGGNCGLTLAPGMDLLIYAMPATSGQIPWTDYCAGTKLQECAKPDLQALGVAVPRDARDCTVPPPKPSTSRGGAVSISIPPSNER